MRRPGGQPFATEHLNLIASMVKAFVLSFHRNWMCKSQCVSGGTIYLWLLEDVGQLHALDRQQQNGLQVQLRLGNKSVPHHVLLSVYVPGSVIL